MAKESSREAVQKKRSRIKEIEGGSLNGLVVMLIWVIFTSFTVPATLSSAIPSILGIVVGAFLVFALKGFFVVNPNEGKVLQLFGDYVGTVKETGLKWTNPFYARRTVSLRVRNFETEKMKVNDSSGNPIEIAAVVVWKVSDAAEAVFQVDNYEQFMKVQSESAIRNLATQHPYDHQEEGELSLRSHTEKIAQKLKDEIQQRLEEAGIEIIEARISHLAYAPEIASVMLRQQQAAAIIAARRQIVEGAVGMVNMALKQIAEKGMAKLDEERKASMISNLLVILCGDGEANPVVNVGSLYH
jgi:regulator of protease activity HflC (stomatin/prohibitin superfamily)